MSACKKMCIFCSAPQLYKVNFTLTHGTCLQHYSNLSEFSYCTHCTSLIPVSLITQLFPCQSCQKQKILSTLPCSHQLCKACKSNCLVCKTEKFSTPVAELQEKCEYCGETRILTTLQCSHKVCSDCKSDVCNICTIDDSPKHYQITELCEYCLAGEASCYLKCGHWLCVSCSKNSCGICTLPSRTNSTCEVCEQCASNPATEACVNGHQTCKYCFSVSCPKCVAFENMDFCEVCKQNKIYAYCSNGHKVCFACSQQCRLCKSLPGSRNFSVQSQSIKGFSGSDDSLGRSKTANGVLCEYCGVNKAVPGNFCDHKFCKNCVSQHKRDCGGDDESEELNVSCSKSFKSEKEDFKDGMDEGASSSDVIVEPGHYMKSSELPERKSGKAEKAANNECKCEVF